MVKLTDNPTAACPHCGGIGVTMVRRGDEQFAAECSCRIEKKAELRLQRARIPQRYTHCSLASFDVGFRGADPSLGIALMATRQFAERYPVETGGRGLLLTGSIGCGKTHLAVGLLREMIEQRGATGIFCDYRDLIKANSKFLQSPSGHRGTEILRPVFNAEVLLLDELGAEKPTDWVWDTVAHILNTRYNDKRTTLITTNYPNRLGSGTATINLIHRQGCFSKRPRRPRHAPCAKKPWEIESENKCDRACRKCVSLFPCKGRIFAARCVARVFSILRENSQRNFFVCNEGSSSRIKSSSEKWRGSQHHQSSRQRSCAIHRVALGMDGALTSLFLKACHKLNAPAAQRPVRRGCIKSRISRTRYPYDVCFGETDSVL